MDLNKVNIVMVRENLLDIPACDLAKGFTFHYYRPGDMEMWFDVERQAYPDISFDRQKFVSTFSNLDILEQRMIFICDDTGRALATSTAWYQNDEVALVHWVAVVPQFQGRGLSKPLIARTLAIMSELGYKSATLQTQIFRIPAINLYLKSGFVPSINSQPETDCWRAVGDKFRLLGLDHTAIDNALGR